MNVTPYLTFLQGTCKIRDAPMALMCKLVFFCSEPPQRRRHSGVLVQQHVPCDCVHPLDVQLVEYPLVHVSFHAILNNYLHGRLQDNFQTGLSWHLHRAIPYGSCTLSSLEYYGLYDLQEYGKCLEPRLTGASFPSYVRPLRQANVLPTKIVRPGICTSPAYDVDLRGQHRTHATTKA